jgi:hypothetical protein
LLLLLGCKFLLLGVFSGQTCWLIMCLLLVIDVSNRPWIVRREPIPKSLYLTGLEFSGETRSNVEIVVSDWPWCFSGRTNQTVVQVFDEFSTSIEVLFNYLVICIVNFKLFPLEGEC